MEMQVYKNKYGVSINKCCASCAHKQYDAKVRLCMKGEGMVSPTSYCQDWKLSECYENVGKGDGKVKKGHYLMYCLRKMDADNALSIERAQKKIAHERLSVNEIREEYRKKYGAIYAL